MIRRTLLSLVLLALAVPAWSQATFDARSSAARTWTPAAPTATLAHTTAAGTNRLLLVAVHMNIRTPDGATVSAVTYGGQPMTQLTAIADATPETRTEVWYMLAPPTGANNVLVTVGGMNAGETVRGAVSATTYSNADQSAPASVTNFGDSTAPSVIIAATATSDTIISFVSAREDTTLTVGAAPQTQRYNFNSGATSNNDVQTGASDRAAATPNTTMTWALGTARRWSIVAVNVRAATADVEIEKYATSDPAIPGGTLIYTMLIQNNGPSSATGVTLTDPIPAATTFISSTTSAGSCSGTTTVTCNIGTLTSGGTATVTITVQVPLTGGFIGTNTATVTTTTVDPATPNTASANAYSLVQATVCGTQPGKDGAGGVLGTPNAVINSYWPGTTANAAVGATGFNVGARRGAAVSILTGDLLLIMQMQDAAINSSNDDRYGDGNGIAGGTSGIGSGSTNLNSVGRYEYAIATTTIGAAGGALTFTAVGGGNGLVYSYTNAAATGTQGQRRYQVVRVPQYTTATLGAGLTALQWNGSTGGILAFDVAGDLALGSVTVDVNGLGFRGAAGIAYLGGAGANTDYRGVIGNTTQGFKGEGIAGSPEWVLDDTGANFHYGAQGYPNGDLGRGAPGNAGGGGTDGHPSANDENSGGGGGANWGGGGHGGNSWQSNLPLGGFGGAPYYDSPGKVVMGGGGGAGSRNNSATIASSGAPGGGIVLIRAGRLTGTGTITANGDAAYNLTDNDGGGGGGAGGSIVVLARGGGLANLTLRANGGRGGDAWSTQAPGGSPGERHGPGGGGGGGYIATNGTINGASTVTGGATGITTTANDTFGAQVGAPGNIVQTASFDEITGVRSGCTDLSVSISDSPDPVIAGNSITYTMAVTNNSTIVPGQNPTITLTTAPGTTFTSITAPAGWTCPTTPSPGGTGTIICTSTTPLAPSTTTGSFTMVLATNSTLANGSTVTQSVTTSTTSPETNTANNTASTNTAVIRRVDVAVTKVTNNPGPDNAFAQGDTLIYTITVTNNGPSQASNVVVTDPLPSGFSFTSVVPGGPTCTQSAGTVTCTYATLNVGATNNITITGTITVNTTGLTNTATSTRNETDTVPANNSATALAAVLSPTAVHLFETNLEQDYDGNVRIAWRTSFEVDNLGFNIYRETGKGRVKVNDHLIPGSALFSTRRQLDSGTSYAWKDTIGRGEFAQYTIEDIDLNGTRTLHGPLMPLMVGSVSGRVTTNASFETDAAVAADSVSGGIFVSPRGTGAAQLPAFVPTKKQREQQFALASQATVKLMIAQEGWYRVTKSQLAAAGFTPGSNISLFTGGTELPLSVTKDGIEFYGLGLDAPGSGARAYWLTNEKGIGLRVSKVKSSAGKVSAARTPFTFERIERTVYVGALTNTGDRANFFGDVVTTNPATQGMTVEHLDRGGSAPSLELVIQGVSEGAHAIRVEVNGAKAGTVTLSGKQRKVSTINVSLSALSEGENTLRLTALDGDADVSVVESVRLTYPHQLVADDDALKVSVAGGTKVEASGFTPSVVRAFDITDPMQPVEVTVETPARGTATILAPQSGTRSILLVGESRVLAPAQVVATHASTWNDRKNAADMVIITNAAFAEPAQPLKTRRDAEGVSTAIVDVGELYDEFSFGEHGPAALREFLVRSRDWKRAPKYVLLLGDASIDPRNYLGFGAFDFVPTKLVPTAYIKTASDDWFTDFDDDGLPALAIGRLPARTVTEAETMVRHIVERDTRGNDKIAFVTEEGTDFDFDASRDTLSALVPPALAKTFASGSTASTFESLLVTYLGHGSVDVWSADGFDGAAALELTNHKLPIVLAMTCLNGMFHDVFTSGLAETLLKNPNGGAVAVWASSSLTGPPAQADIAAELYRQLFAGATLGDAAMRSKAATTDPDVRRSWILFADPSMKLR